MKKSSKFLEASKRILWQLLKYYVFLDIKSMITNLRIKYTTGKIACISVFKDIVVSFYQNII